MLRQKNYIVLITCLLALFFSACKKQYTPQVIAGTNNFLVVTGFINTAVNSPTKIILSRTVGLQDTILFIPEENASVNIESNNGTVYPLRYSSNGNYVSDTLSLDNTRKYRLNIETSGLKKYQSEFVDVKQTPPIDSVVWRQDKGNVIIYANTHDPSNTTRYYWWDYTETWNYKTPNLTIYGVSNGRIYVRTPEQQIENCWSSRESSDLLIGNSSLLTDDVISMQPLLTILNRDRKLNIRYSILVRQYAMTAEAYTYWKKIKNNSQQLGTLFDEQPTQLRGNMYSLEDIDEPVIGFVGAARPQEQRIFIQHSELTDWTFDPFTGYTCAISYLPQSSPDPYIYNYNDPYYVPWYFISSGPLVIVGRECVDCTLQGGTTQRPSFW